MRRTAQCLDPITSLQFGAGAQPVNDSDHRLTVEHAGNVMGDGGHDFAPSRCGKLGKQRCHNLPANVRESITIEKEKRRPPVALPEEFYGFGEGEDLPLLG